MTTNHPCSVDVGSMVDGLMNSSEESTLPSQLFSALSDAERMQLCVHQIPVAVSLEEAHRGASTLEEVEEGEEDDIEFERREMMKAAAGVNHGMSDTSADPLLVKQQLTKEEIIAAGKTKSRNVWSPPKNTRKAPIDHDDYDLEEETIPGLEGFMEGGGNDDALLLAALDDTGAASGDGPGLSSVHFDNYSLEDNGNSSSTAASPFPFGESTQVPRASRNITNSSATPVAASTTTAPSTTTRHNDPEPCDQNDDADTSTDLEEEDALALLAGCEEHAKDGAVPAITNIKEELREVHVMIEEHTETEVLPFSAPASDDEGPLTSKPMSPYE